MFAARALRFLPALAFASFAGLAAGAAGCAAEDPFDSGEEEEPEGITEDPLSAPQASGPLRFGDACRAGTKITIAAVGDVLLHKGLQVQSYASDDSHRSLWKGIEPLLSRADLTYANLEGPAAEGVTTSGQARDPGKVFDGAVYSSYPQFNYHPSLVTDLKEAGFDVVSTANNHSLDRRALGADRTIDNLERAGLAFTGTRRAGDSEQPWYAITEARGVRVAWLSCTFSTNGIPDRQKQVLKCYEDRSTVLATVRELSARRDVDAVIVTPHWGDVEYTHHPAQKEKNLAREMIEAGALAVLGAHPHVVQPWDKITASDGREGFVIYSLGNFVSGQRQLPRRSSLVLYLGLTKGADGKVTVNGVRHLPIEMHNAPWTARIARGDSAALTTRILGQWNALDEDEPLVTNPECN